MAKRAEPPQVLRHVHQRQTPRYTPRRPERRLLYRIVADNLETFLETARERNVSGLGLPRYVEREFREYLQHRFGGSLNLNTHLHAVVVDGVFEKVVSPTGDEPMRLHPLPPPEPVDLAALAHDIYRQFLTWLKKRGLIRLADVDETFEKEDALASCLRGSLGIGRVVAMTTEGDVSATDEDHDAQRFSLRRSPHIGEFGGFSIHAGVTVHAANRVPG